MESITVNVTGGTKEDRLVISHLIKNNISSYVKCDISKSTINLENALAHFNDVEVKIEENELSIKEIKSMIREELEDFKDDLLSIKKDLEIINNEVFGKIGYRYENCIKNVNRKLNLLSNELSFLLGDNTDRIIQKYIMPHITLGNFKVICDETNNNPTTIKNNELFVDIYFPKIDGVIK